MVSTYIDETSYSSKNKTSRYMKRIKLYINLNLTRINDTLFIHYVIMYKLSLNVYLIFSVHVRYQTWNHDINIDIIF